MNFRPIVYLKLATLLRRVRIDSHRHQLLEVLSRSRRIDGVESLLALFQADQCERKRHPKHVIVVVEKAADMGSVKNRRVIELKRATALSHFVSEKILFVGQIDRLRHKTLLRKPTSSE